MHHGAVLWSKETNSAGCTKTLPICALANRSLGMLVPGRGRDQRASQQARHGVTIPPAGRWLSEAQTCRHAYDSLLVTSLSACALLPYRQRRFACLGTRECAPDCSGHATQHRTTKKQAVVKFTSASAQTPHCSLARKAKGVAMRHRVHEMPKMPARDCLGRVSIATHALPAGLPSTADIGRSACCRLCQSREVLEDLETLVGVALEQLDTSLCQRLLRCLTSGSTLVALCSFAGTTPHGRPFASVAWRRHRRRAPGCDDAHRLPHDVRATP